MQVIQRFSFSWMFFILLFGRSLLYGQQIQLSYHHILSIPIEAKSIATDHLQNIYAITNNNEIVKYNSKGQELFRFNENTQGNLAFVDTSNPLNLLLFYPDFQTVLLLDRTLTEQVRIGLQNLDIPVVTAIGWARDNQIWIYDELNFKLKKINTKEELTASSENLSLILPEIPHPLQIKVYDNWVCLNDPAMGVLVFDQFGQYDRTIPLKGLNSIQILGDALVAQRVDSSALQYNLMTGQTHSIQLPATLAPDATLHWQKGFLMALGPESIEVFAFSENNKK